MTFGANIGTLFLGVAGSLIAAFMYDAYAKKRDKGDFKAEKTALELLDFAIAILPEEDRAEYSDQWLADLVSLDTARQRIRFACGFPRAAVILRTKALVSIPFVLVTKQFEVVTNRVDWFKVLMGSTIVSLLLLAIFLFIYSSTWEQFTWCINQDGHRVTCDTTHRPDLRSHPW
jgi:hypothetical protein